ncbi:MAG: hypothetical protein BJ554DRAFT_6429 [Olpidium bornovanus]|uniref:Uncharacterized protein n=1 Tax=Olpidium bornovanus TaxID=278681 RepID=A0A8H7ZXZ6_9FUNG|nr:MAG: hypothetical protein BJ554DRAFT_6429 [Olpidium bornovanus]
MPAISPEARISSGSSCCFVGAEIDFSPRSESQRPVKYAVAKIVFPNPQIRSSAFLALTNSITALLPGIRNV